MSTWYVWLQASRHLDTPQPLAQSWVPKFPDPLDQGPLPGWANLSPGPCNPAMTPRAQPTSSGRRRRSGQR
eukprot:s3782_g2.t1